MNIAGLQKMTLLDFPGREAFSLSPTYKYPSCSPDSWGIFYSSVSTAVTNREVPVV